MPVGIEPGYDHDIQFTLHEPIGVIACVILFNFPPALWSFKVGSLSCSGQCDYLEGTDV